MGMHAPFSLRRELRRKALHITSGLGAPALLWLPDSAALALFCGVSTIALGLDLLRLNVRPVRAWMYRHFRTLLRGKERRRLSGASWMVMSYTLAAVLLPAPLAALAILFVAFGDAAAALVGRALGRRTKSKTGFLAGLFVNCLSAAAIVSFIPELPWYTALAGAGAASLAEAWETKLDDNFRMVIASGAVMYLLAG